MKGCQGDVKHIYILFMDNMSQIGIPFAGSSLQAIKISKKKSEVHIDQFPFKSE